MSNETHASRIAAQLAMADGEDEQASEEWTAGKQAAERAAEADK